MTFLHKMATDIQLFFELSTFAVMLLILAIFLGLQYLVKETYIPIPEES
jgi:hypothetical protein